MSSIWVFHRAFWLSALMMLRLALPNASAEASNIVVNASFEVGPFFFNGWQTNGAGDTVSPGEVIGYVANPYDDSSVEVRSPRRGIIIGRTTLPILNMGDALFHVAWSEEIGGVRPDRDATAEPVMDEDEII